MTPTEQGDDRAKLIIEMSNLLHRHFQAQRKATVEAFANAQGDLVNFITADRKRVVLEARMATLDALDNHKKTLDYIVKDGAPRNHTNYEVYLRKAIEVDTKIAELKAQQEEV